MNKLNKNGKLNLISAIFSGVVGISILLLGFFWLGLITLSLSAINLVFYIQLSKK